MLTECPHDDSSDCPISFDATIQIYDPEDVDEEPFPDPDPVRKRGDFIENTGSRIIPTAQILLHECIRPGISIMRQENMLLTSKRKV
eukprot:scaffold9857_cov195-Amphora_coffeaeformis.AAC.7